MTRLSDLKLSAVAEIIGVHLEQTSRTGAWWLSMRVAVICECSVGAAEGLIRQAFQELLEERLVESFIPGIPSNKLGCCLPEMSRSYSLSRRGHTWKCNRLRKNVGIRVPVMH